MTVYVDNARIPATIGQGRKFWSHLTADTPEELHDFAKSIGLRRGWFQGRCVRLRSCPTRAGVCRHFHYDVTDYMRGQAITAGARSIDIRELGAITSARSDAYRPGARS